MFLNLHILKNKMYLSIETLDYNRFEPIIGGLFCERIFGPVKDFECFCRRYKKLHKKLFQKSKINLCPKCNIELTSSSIRSYRLGYVRLASHISHYWFLRNLPSYISIILNKSNKETLKIAYHKSYVILKKSNSVYSITGAEALYFLLKKLDIKDKENIVSTKDNPYPENIIAYKNRLKLLNFFIQTKTKPEWMILKYLPVLPPDIRPIVKIQDKTVVTTDLNFSYLNIISTNNKITKLRKMLVPEKFLSNEKLFLQQKVDTLIVGEKSTLNNRNSDKLMKSLSSSIKGKKGLFRENILGKTVDYSGRSVIVVEPKLDLNEFGIPEEMVVLIIAYSEKYFCLVLFYNILYFEHKRHFIFYF